MKWLEVVVFVVLVSTTSMSMMMGVVDAADDMNNSTTASTSRVIVHIPNTMYHSIGEHHVQAEFGFTNRPEGSISQFVYYTPSNICHALNDTTPLFPTTTQTKKSPFILLTQTQQEEEEDCSYVSKVRYGQHFGASAVLIGVPGYVNHGFPRFVDDTGTGGDVTIPSFLIGKEFCNLLINVLQSKNEPVLMEVTWGLPDTTTSTTPPSKDDALVPGTDISYELWTTARDPLWNVDTYRAFQTITMQMFPDNPTGISFQPYFSIMDGERFQCKENDPGSEERCKDLCTNQGRYCSIQDEDLTGKEIITESLRRLCIYSRYHATTDNNNNGGNGGDDPPPSMVSKKHRKKNKNDLASTAYWEYVIAHIQQCSDPDQYGDPNCIAKAYKAANINQETIDDCMLDSGGLEADGSNHMLEQQMQHETSSGIVSIPSITFTNHRSSGIHSHSQLLQEPTPSFLLQAMCNYYWQASSMITTTTSTTTMVPDTCISCANCPNVLGCMQNKGQCVDFDHTNNGNKSPTKGASGESHNNKKHGHPWLWTFFILFLLAGGWVYMRRRNGLDINPFANVGYGADNAGVLQNYFQLGQGEE